MKVGKYHPWRNPVGHPGGRFNLTATGCDTHTLVSVETQLQGIIRIHFHKRSVINFQQTAGAPGHLSTVPVIENTAGAQQEGVVVVRQFSRWNMFHGHEFTPSARELPYMQNRCSRMGRVLYRPL